MIRMLRLCECGLWSSIALLLAAFALLLLGGCESNRIVYERDGVKATYESTRIFEDKSVGGVSIASGEDGSIQASLESSESKARLEAVNKALEVLSQVP